METTSPWEEQGVHYEHSEDHSTGSYPPPTYMYFTFEDYCSAFPPLRPSPIIFHCEWLGGPHDIYPVATTLDKYMRLRGTEGALGTREHAALIQSMLTFGLLEAVLRVKIAEPFLLVQAADGAKTLSTANLAVILRDGHHRCNGMHHPDQCRSWLEDASATLFEAGQRLMAYCFDLSSNPFLAAGLHLKATADIIRVLYMISQLLRNLLVYLPPECSQHAHIHDRTPLYLSPFEGTRNHARAQGWCPRTVAELEFDGFVVLEYVRSLPPFIRHAGEHSLCTEYVCTVNNIDPTTYIRRHSSDECDCTPIIPPIHLVHSFLSNTCIPVITVSDEGLSVLAAEEVPYVAISHVWIDGLGSTTEEGLAACQVAHIASMASSLVPNGAFWIDALCVPGQRDLRKQAIRLMAKTYTDAAAVLVIDAGIRSCSKDAPLEEKLLRIVTSGWMQRLWTYQEAMLAKALWFELADGLVELQELVPSLEERNIMLPLSRLQQPLLSIIFRPSGQSTKKPVEFVDLVNAIGWRTTSKPEDETLAIAGLLQIDMRELLNAPSSDERMKSFLLQVKRFGPEIIFSAIPRISGIPGFSWAPRSFMSGRLPLLARGPGESEAMCTPAGLLAEYSSLIFSEPVELDEYTQYVIHDTGLPTRSFRLEPIALTRDGRREFCNAVLVLQNGFHSRHYPCVGVRMVDMEELGTFGESELVCYYQDIHFNLYAMEVSKASQLQASGTPVIHAGCLPRMKVKLV